METCLTISAQTSPHELSTFNLLKSDSQTTFTLHSRRQSPIRNHVCLSLSHSSKDLLHCLNIYPTSPYLYFYSQVEAKVPDRILTGGCQRLLGKVHFTCALSEFMPDFFKQNQPQMLHGLSNQLIVIFSRSLPLCASPPSVLDTQPSSMIATFVELPSRRFLNLHLQEAECVLDCKVVQTEKGGEARMMVVLLDNH